MNEWSIVRHGQGLFVNMPTGHKSRNGCDMFAAVGGYDSTDDKQQEMAEKTAQILVSARDLLDALEGLLTFCTAETARQVDLVIVARHAVNKAKGRI
jgi:hypothetical protein